jgi:hypothetical protein
MTQITFWKGNRHYCAIQTHTYFQQNVVSGYVWVRFRARPCENYSGTKCHCYTLLHSVLVSVIQVMFDVHISFHFTKVK